MRLWMAIAASALLYTVPAVGQQQDEFRTYSIHHALFGDIGTLRDAIYREGSQTRGVTQVEVKVGVLGVTLHQFQADWSETWADEILMNYRAMTTRNGNAKTICGHQENGAFVVSIDERKFLAPSDIHPVHPWSLRFIRAATLISPESGRIFPASIVDKGDTWISIEGKRRSVHHYVALFEHANHLYFDDMGTLLLAEYRDITGSVKLTLQSSSERAAARAD